MKTIFKTYQNSDYYTVCQFLMESSQADPSYIHWNWARWEWMYFHPEFNHELADKIGLWFSNSNELIGMTTYDHYFGEAFYAVKPSFAEIEQEILDYTMDHFQDENGLGIAVNDTDSHVRTCLVDRGFIKNAATENILVCQLKSVDLHYATPGNIVIKNIDPQLDLYKHQKVLWEGFENEGNMPLDKTTIDKQKRMLSAPHLNPYLHIVAENRAGDYVAYCGCWYHPDTDYAYIEPVCTIPEYRNKGLGKAVLLEALKRSYSLGAKSAYVLSDAPFYQALGFEQHSHYTFYFNR